MALSLENIMRTNTLLYEVIDHSQYVVTDYNEYDEPIEVALPENIRVFTELSENDFRQGRRNNYAVSM